MIKKLSVLLLASSLLMVSGIFAEAAADAAEVVKVKKTRRASGKRYSNGDVKENNEIVRVSEGGEYETRSGRGHHHGRATSCGQSGCRMCTNVCAEEPVCEKTVCGKVYAPACAHVSTIKRYTCPPEYEVTEAPARGGCKTGCR